MITAVFYRRDGKYSGFRISGHSGYSESGSDIVCAACSAMTMLTVNTVTDILGVSADVVSDESDASVRFSLKSGSETASSLIEGLRSELTALESDYPDNVRVITQ